MPVLIPFGLLLLAGITSLIVHDNRSITFTNISIIFGVIGTVWGLIMLTYRMIYIYESEFDNKRIDLKIRKDKIFINFSNISDMKYEKLTMFNYLTSYRTKLFPGILKVNVKENDVKVKDIENKKGESIYEQETREIKKKRNNFINY